MKKPHLKIYLRGTKESVAVFVDNHCFAIHSRRELDRARYEANRLAWLFAGMNHLTCEIIEEGL